MSRQPSAVPITRREVLKTAFLASTVPLLGALSSPARAATPTGIKRGGTLRVGIYANPTTLDPFLATAGRDNAYLYHLYDNLVGLDENYLPVKNHPSRGLAISWEYEDPKTLVFTLRNGVKFHDGTPLDAEAVKFSLDKMLADDTRSTFKSDISTVVVGAQVVARNKVRVRFSRPSTSTLVGLGTGGGTIVSPNAYKKLDKEFGLMPVGSGPFKFKSWTKDSTVVLERNPDYWGKDANGAPLPYLNTIEFRIQPNNALQFLALRAGDIDAMVDVAGKDRSAARNAGDLIYNQRTSYNYHEFRINTTKGPLANVHARRALIYAINYDAINKAVYFGTGTSPWQGFIAPGTPFFDATLNLVKYDPAKAKEELKAANMPGGFEFTFQNRNFAEFEQEAQVIQQNLKDVGVTMKTETLEAAAVLANQQSGNFEVSSGNRPGRPDPILDVTEHTCVGGQKPYSGLCDNEFDTLVARADQQTDFAKRKVMLRQVNERFILNAPTIGFGYFPATVAHHPSVKSFFNPRNLVIRDLQFTWLDK